MIGFWSNCIVPGMVVEGEVGTGVQVQVVQGDERLAFLRERLQEGKET